MKHKIVTLGTGTGQRRLLQGLDPKRCDVTAIVGVSDNGGSSATIRKALQIPQPGDTRNCLTALATNKLQRKLFDHRFQEGELAGTNVGNYILGALTQIEGDFGLAVERANELLATTGRVLPVTTASTHVCAELVTGTKIIGEWEIIRRSPRAKILRVYLETPVTIYPPAAEAVRDADLIVFGPGSLRTGIVPVALTTGLLDAIHDSKAAVAYVCNIMTQPGQTDGYSARDHVLEIERYLRLRVDHILLNSAPVPTELVEHFRRLGSEPVANNLDGDLRVLAEPFLQPDSIETLQQHDRPDNVFFLYHDPTTLGEALIGLIE